MAGRLLKRSQAESDLNEIAAHLHEQADSRTADRFLNAAERACELLADMPLMGSALELDDPLLADLRVWTIRKFRKYIILYIPIRDGIEVVRVVRGSRDWLKMLEDA